MISAEMLCGIESHQPAVGVPSRERLVTLVKSMVVGPLYGFVGAKLRDFFLREPVRGQHFVGVLTEARRHRADCRRSRGQAIGRGRDGEGRQSGFGGVLEWMEK